MDHFRGKSADFLSETTDFRLIWVHWSFLTGSADSLRPSETKLRVKIGQFQRNLGLFWLHQLSLGSALVLAMYILDPQKKNGPERPQTYLTKNVQDKAGVPSHYSDQTFFQKNFSNFFQCQNQPISVPNSLSVNQPTSQAEAMFLCFL